MDFRPFGKIARLSRECVITEKLDGTNAQVCIYPTTKVRHTNDEDYEIRLPGGFHIPGWIDTGDEWEVAVRFGSRTRWLKKDQDNHGFYAWASAHVEELLQLGIGSHFGEWWGRGIQRGYGLEEKRFSLFNTGRWADHRDDLGEGQQYPPTCCDVVPVLYRGMFNTGDVDDTLRLLADFGSAAALGFMNPEGVVVYHTAAGTYFKKTLQRDEAPKGYFQAAA